MPARSGLLEPRGDVGRTCHLDRDGDGVGCELPRPLAEGADIDSLIGRLVISRPAIRNIEPSYPGKDPRWPMPIAGQIAAVI